MEFLLDNYIWFIIGFIVILMIVIGYLAEKTQFGSKKITKKDKNVKKKKEVEVLEQVEQAKNTRINEAILENAELLKKAPIPTSSVAEPMPSIKEKEVKEELIPEELTVPFGNIDSLKETRMETMREKDTVEVPPVESKKPSIEETFEETYTPLEEKEEALPPLMEQEDHYEEEKVKMPLPDIQGLREEKTDEDDVWDF